MFIVDLCPLRFGLLYLGHLQHLTVQEARRIGEVAGLSPGVVVEEGAGASEDKEVGHRAQHDQEHQHLSGEHLDVLFG